MKAEITSPPMGTEAYMFPTSVKEVEALGWDFIDIIFITGDAFVDHPSFGTACIARYLQKYGYRIAIVPQTGTAALVFRGQRGSDGLDGQPLHRCQTPAAR